LIQVAQSSLTRVLLAQESPSDVRLLRYALSGEQTWQTEIKVAEDGEQVIRLLQSENPANQEFRTNLLILDLNLPKRDGAEVLQFVRSNFVLRQLPVIVVSSLPEEVIIQRVSRANQRADGYFTKPTGALECIALGPKLRRCYEKCQLASFAYR
jgi:chemotaxis family two-component system response regulator Rcp1